MRRVLVRILAAQGYAVLEAQHGREALCLLEGPEAARVDLVLLDLTMPVLGGLATLERLGERHAGLPVVLMSGFSEVPAHEDGRGPGARPTGFLAKPFERATVVRCVADALAAVRA